MRITIAVHIAVYAVLYLHIMCVAVACLDVDTDSTAIQPPNRGLHLDELQSKQRQFMVGREESPLLAAAISND
jgi:hypothetical protein